MTVTCDYCQSPAELVDSAIVYHGRSYGNIWYCAPCQAWVGCHKTGNNDKPLGRLANAELRKAKMRAHAAFDPLWRRGNMTRTNAYRWLAKQMRLTARDCHIGMFDAAQCQQVVDLVEKQKEVTA